jgi:predicted nuclease of restriction endonuclease-like (RecB) superfamily
MKLARRASHRSVRIKHGDAFREIVGFIQSARPRAVRAVNTALIDLYWRIGEAISERICSDGWGRSTVASLAVYIRRQEPSVRGFSAPNLWRMRQFYETWRSEKKLSARLRELTWTHHLLLMSRCKRGEEREFYLRAAAQRHWSVRQLEREISACLFERAVLSPPKLSSVMRELHADAETVFKDSYLIEFLQLPESHSESDLHRGLVRHLKDFLIELGRDFCFIGSEYSVQVGGKDFFLDLLFFNRALSCLVAFELKTDDFKPEYLGKLEFYLEALDRDVRKPHEHPSIGVLLCATKDNEVVEYALSRSVSPALIAEYQTRLPDKRLLQRKLREFYQLALPVPAARSRKSSPKTRKS